ncbi:MAG: hypothetical protein R6U70_04830 [Bacillota bacterium]
MCEEASYSILAAGFAPELGLIGEALSGAEERDARVYVLQFGREDLRLRNQFLHRVSSLQERQVLR